MIVMEMQDGRGGGEVGRETWPRVVSRRMSVSMQQEKSQMVEVKQDEDELSQHPPYSYLSEA